MASSRHAGWGCVAETGTARAPPFPRNTVWAPAGGRTPLARFFLLRPHSLHCLPFAAVSYSQSTKGSGKHNLQRWRHHACDGGKGPKTTRGSMNHKVDPPACHPHRYDLGQQEGTKQNQQREKARGAKAKGSRVRSYNGPHPQESHSPRLAPQLHTVTTRVKWRHQGDHQRPRAQEFYWSCLQRPPLPGTDESAGSQEEAGARHKPPRLYNVGTSSHASRSRSGGTSPAIGGPLASRPL